jgi:hypothetical protein
MATSQVLRSYEITSIGFTHSDSQIIDDKTGQVLYSTDVLNSGLNMVKGDDNKSGESVGKVKFPGLRGPYRITMPDGNGGTWQEELKSLKFWSCGKHKAFSVPTEKGLRKFEWKGTKDIKQFEDSHKTSMFNLKVVDSATGATVAVFVASYAKRRKGRLYILQDPGVGPQGDALIMITGLTMYEIVRGQETAAIVAGNS